MAVTLKSLRPKHIDARAEETARLLRALGNRHRLLILCHLLEVTEASAGELALHLDLSHSSLSQHLRRMRDEGLVASRRQIRTILYRVGEMGDSRLPMLLKGICAPSSATSAGEADNRAARTHAVLAMALGENSSAPLAEVWQTPAITTAGAIQVLPKAAYQPDPDAECRIVFTLGTAAPSPTEVHPGLARVARTINLYVGAGLTREQLHCVAIASGAAIELALSDSYYHQRHGIANPNLALIRELGQYGIDVAVCGQTIAAQGYESHIAPGVTVALSSLTTVAELQRQGHAVISL